MASNVQKRAGNTASALLKPLAVSAFTGLGGLILFAVAMAVGMTSGWLATAGLTMFLLGSVLSILCIPAMMLVGAGGNAGLGLAKSVRAELAHRSARKKFLKERKPPQLTAGDPDSENQAESS